MHEDARATRTARLGILTPPPPSLAAWPRRIRELPGELRDPRIYISPSERNNALSPTSPALFPSLFLVESRLFAARTRYPAYLSRAMFSLPVALSHRDVYPAIIKSKP